MTAIFRPARLERDTTRCGHRLRQPHPGRDPAVPTRLPLAALRHIMLRDPWSQEADQPQPVL